ncbi:MAG TPA: methylenetetrahydrofolate reductase, partial [Paracoccaceae bacterium]|nr:methylenetetrahydrofolate reductase [Paracoccaceae bacterium]
MSHPKVSFEFFPPRNLEASFRLWDCVNALSPLAPDFISVTYGAGGTTRQLTHEAVTTLHRATGLPVAAHLTCVNASRAEIDEVVRGYASVGVRHIVALRGDPPTGVGTRYVPHPEGYAQAADLVAGIKRIGGFEVSVGGYPEKHPESQSFEA